MTDRRTYGFDENVQYTPFVDPISNRVGYRVIRLHDGAITYVYMNPSTSGRGMPDVFVYSGPANDPGVDPAVLYVIPDFESCE